LDAAEILGSAFAGVKAGILGGIVFAGGIGLFNAILLFAFRGDVLQVLGTLPACAGSSAGSQIATPEDCFSTLLSVNLPFFVFEIFVISLFFAGVFGAFFEVLPARGYTTRAAVVAFLMLIVILFAGAGLFTSDVQRLIIVGYELVLTFVYAAILSRFYRRYTREVEFQTPESGSGKILMDNHNYTGKVRTLSIHSSHTVRAESEERAFKEWLVSGGVTVEDPKSFETTIKVEGDGLLKGVFVARG
jgi:hypothetical protein